MNEIIRSTCIEGDTEFKYMKVRNNGPEWKQISEKKRRSGGVIEET